MNNIFRPLSRTNYVKNLSLAKITKPPKIPRKNLSSLARRNNYSNSKLFHKNSLIQNKPKLFSLLDINHKIISRGTEFHEQYRRLTDDESQRLFGFSYRSDYEEIKKNIQNKNTKNKNILIKSASDIGERLKLKKTMENFQKKYNYDDNEKNKENEDFKRNNNINNDYKSTRIFNIKKNSIKLIKNKNISSSPIVNLDDNENNKENILYQKSSTTKKDKDIYIPKGYTQYELLLKYPKLFAKKLKFQNPTNKSLTAKFIKEKSNKSDIFFFKPPSEKEALYNKNSLINSKRDYQTSDIFNIKNDVKNLIKSGEKFLFKKNNSIKYDINRESNSRWKPSENHIFSINTSSSKDYNILNPKSKNITLTKEKIVIECEKMKDKNSKMINSVNYMNPIFKKKGLTEFIDITRNGASNNLKDYSDIYRKNPKCFFKVNETCSTFYDTHFMYKNLCKKPFVKDFFN